MIPYVCALCFALFSFLYLFFLQSDFLAQTQFHLSGGATSYFPLGGAMLISAGLTLLGMLVGRLFTFPIRLLALAWVPSCYLLLLLCSMPLETCSSDHYQTPYIWLVLLPLLYAVSLSLCRLYPDFSGENQSLSIYLSSNLLLLSIFLCLTGMLGNASQGIHYDLRVARLVHEDRFTQALQVGRKSDFTSDYLTSHRVYALARQGKLGEQLFTYPLSSGSSSMLMNTSDTTWVFRSALRSYHLLGAVFQGSSSQVDRFLERVCERDSLHTPVKRDFLLCSYLMDKRLDCFASAFTDTLTTDSLLPAHYREALMLCQDLGYTARRIHDQPTAEKYLRFTHLMAQYQQTPQCSYHCYIHFGQTYWFYYHFR